VTQQIVNHKANDMTLCHKSALGIETAYWNRIIVAPTKNSVNFHLSIYIIDKQLSLSGKFYMNYPPALVCCVHHAFRLFAGLGKDSAGIVTIAIVQCSECGAMPSTASG